jgi:hypothetical protein
MCNNLEMFLKLIISKYNNERSEVPIKGNGQKAVELLDNINMYT